MPDYIIKTRNNRNIVIEADEVYLDRDSAIYQFRNHEEDKRIRTVGYANYADVQAVAQ